MSRAAINLPLSPGILSVLIALSCSFEVAAAAATNAQQLETKAQQGYVKQQMELAAAYYNGDGVPQNPKLAAYWYQKAAESGNAEAQNQVGYFYEAGLGVPADPAQALHWYQLSAASGLPDAKLNLGVLYVLGFGVPKNEALAAQYFEDAAAKGSGVAADYLGTLNYFGLGVKQDKPSAERWYSLGEKLHDPISAYNLATLYSVAPDHPQDLPRAAALLRQSAKAGYVPAMHSLALILVHNPRLARSPQEPIHLLQSAGDAGYWRSSVLLGILARDGIGTPPDKNAAYFHFQVALLQGGPAVYDLLSRDLLKLTVALGDHLSNSLASDANIWYQQHHLTLTFVNQNRHKGKLYSVPGHADPSDVLRASLPLASPAS